MVKIGLEIHMYPKTKSKLFCSCKTDLTSQSNTNICPVCTGQPGSKPKGINKRAFEICLMMAKVLNCEIIDKKIFFQRKHYFYPDSPNNYQRTSEPIAVKGNFKGVHITEIHLEEDPGQYELKKGEVDFNRSGFPLIEIVTEPDMKTSKEAVNFLNDLKEVIDYLEIGREGFKVDTNVSTTGERVEVKNINSIENVKKAIDYEIWRQSQEKIKLETRHFDAMKEVTIASREKETVADYRYIKDPDVPPLLISESMLDFVMPEDLFKLRQRLIEEYKLTEDQVKSITSEQEMIVFYEKLASINPELVANWIKTDLKGELNYRNLTLKQANIDLDQIEELLKALSTNLTALRGKDILRDYLDNDKSVTVSLNETQDFNLEEIIEEVISNNKESVERYKSGKTQVLNFLIGEVSKRVNKQIDSNEIRKLLLERI